MAEYIDSRGRTRLMAVPYLAGECGTCGMVRGDGPWGSQMRSVVFGVPGSLSQTVVELQRHCEVAASEFQPRFESPCAWRPHKWVLRETRLSLSECFFSRRRRGVVDDRTSKASVCGGSAPCDYAGLARQKSLAPLISPTFGKILAVHAHIFGAFLPACPSVRPTFRCFSILTCGKVRTWTPFYCRSIR